MHNTVHTFDSQESLILDPIVSELPVSPSRLMQSASEPTDRSDRDALTLENLAAVRIVAKRIQSRLPNHVELNDLESAGLVGLLDAASRFDLNRKVQFTSYAQIRIRGAILDFLRTLDWSPRDLRRKARAIREVTQNLSVELGREPLSIEVAGEMGLPLAEFQQITSTLNGTGILSLDAETGEDGEVTLVDSQAGSLGACPLQCTMDREQRDLLAAAIDTLPERERLVITLSFYEELTLKEVGLILGVVESRASQIRASALKRLQRALQGQGTSLRDTSSVRTLQTQKIVKGSQVSADNRRRGIRTHVERRKSSKLC